MALKHIDTYIHMDKKQQTVSHLHILYIHICAHIFTHSQREVYMYTCRYVAPLAWNMSYCIPVQTPTHTHWLRLLHTPLHTHWIRSRSVSAGVATNQDAYESGVGQKIKLHLYMHILLFLGKV